MFTAPASRWKPGGFTLLEITLAVAILAMMSLAIYRFVQTNLFALRVSSENNVVDAQYSGFENLVTAEWQNLPTGQGALTGEPIKLNDRARDEVTWTCTAGPGLMTRYAAGEYRVSLRLRPMGKESERLELGLARKAKADAEIGEERESWVPLLPDVQSVQIRYFDPRVNQWIDRWADTMALPRLIKLVIGRANSSVPWETVIALGRTPL
ncbi:MAG: prepilin-type N-terminal cleavage/methylation domain-containing protein [Chthoniobacterales bacterium]|nr:prepilin-type N-terminal cleavage/methylation domain-containing protein [Chthoniobacterales bacterium]